MDIEKKKFKLKSKFKPAGDQAAAIKGLISGMKSGKNMQTLLGVTGSGKTFTMANVIAKVGKPTLVLAHNKTLAAQLYEEMREFFPENRVEYFISYYDYYQPESYLPAKDQFIEKDSAINPRIEQMRHATTASLLSRNDVIVVASVSCIYGLGSPKTYKKMGCDLNVGDSIGRKDFIGKLVGMTFERNDLDLKSGKFRVKGDVVDFVPGYSDNIIRIEFFGDEIERIAEIDKNTGEVVERMKYFYVWPARNYVVPEEVFDRAVGEIRDQLKIDLNMHDDELIAHRLKQRTNFDVEMMQETGTCKGIENYSRHFDGRKEGEQAFCLLDYFPKNDFLMIIDESHRTIPQVSGMFNGDKARKKNLIDYGFRLTSAYDNRPLMFKEFEKYLKSNSAVFVSATPGDYEGGKSEGVVEQIIRPTGLVDPEVEIRRISPVEKGNIVLVHGSALRDKEKIKAGRRPINERNWYTWFGKELKKENVRIDIPLMPKNYCPKYEDWKKEFEKIEVNEDSILIGHSNGAVFLTRWLGETKRKIKKLIFVAPSRFPFKDSPSCFHKFKDFEIDESIKDRIEEMIIFVSNDKDHIVKSAKLFYEKLGGRYIELEDRKHFGCGNKEFPELVEEVVGRRDIESYGGQVRDCLVEIDKAVKSGSRVLLTTLTKRMAEELTDFLGENGVKCRYMHSEIDTFERTEILRELRLGKFDVLVGINLLREGIDIPEIGFVGVLDADKEGFLRDARSLIQIIGRAARNSEARVVLYADNVTGSIKKAMGETTRRRKIQVAYNEKHGITPKTIVKPIRDKQVEIKDVKSIPKAEIKNVIIELEADMKEAAELLDFERAIFLRGRVGELRKRLK
ncbi:DEAD/DEAH box helicase family protein [archaeon]|jgi:excinuclease UvrABC helicase subunit UvrB/predicted alpha/beta hydrolase family esterase|nr:DEAD/DEAH box helicase family protein [archaeon]